MVRNIYGLTPGDVIAQPTASTTDDPTALGILSSSVTVTVWDFNRTAQITDLTTVDINNLSAAGTAITGGLVPVQAATGRAMFKGPDGVATSLWVLTPATTDTPSQWYLFHPYDLASRVGGVSTVNGATGAITLTADTVPDGTTKVEMLAAERTKLTGVATGATANSTDAYLLDRSHHTGTDNAPTGAVPGQVMTVDINNHVVAADPTSAATAVFNFADAVDVDDTAPVDGDVAVWSAPAALWKVLPRARAVFVYSAGEALDPGQPPGLILDKAAVTVTKSHVIEGTNGTSATAAALNYNSLVGGVRNFTNAQAMVGTTSVLIAAGTQGYYVDSGLAMDVCVVKRRIRFQSPFTGAVNFARMGATAAGIAVLQRDNTAGAIKLKDGTGTTRATSTFTTVADTWYIYEWKVGNSSQTLRWYDAGGTLIGEITTTASAGQVDNTWNGVDINFGSGLFLDDNAVAADWLGNVG